MEWIVENIDLRNIDEIERVRFFLKGFDLKYESDVDTTKVIRRDGEIVATCSKSGKVLKCFAIDSSMQGEGLTSLLIKSLEDQLFKSGSYEYFIFTKPENIVVFENLGYKLVEKVEKVALLQGGFGGVEKFVKKIKKTLRHSSKRGAIVMNCNPFTLGHRYLIELASKQVEELIIFVVEEDKSVFPFEDRYRLVVEGVEDIENVRVEKGGDYIISGATFPSYFLKDEKQVTKGYSTLDAKIFSKYFCKELGIVKRFVGEEPLCPVTRAYNEALKDVLGRAGIEVEIVPRKESGANVISASRVRKILKEKGVVEELKNLVPKTTYEYFKSECGQKVIANLIN